MARINWKLREHWLKFFHCFLVLFRYFIWNNRVCQCLRNYHGIFIHNSFNSFEVGVHTVINPYMIFLNKMAHIIGPFLVILVVTIVSSVVFIVYICLLPQRFRESYLWTAFHLTFGHWLLVNIVFHYFKAAFTDPGSPPRHIVTVVAVCRQCIAPKPPRTHHCGVCGRCILRMDHHCPWINNCVGLRNHRHFYLFMVYLWVGSLYVCIKAYPEFKRHFYSEYSLDKLPFPGPMFIANVMYMPQYSEPNQDVFDSNSSKLPDPPLTQSWLHFIICYEYMLTSTVTFALGLLLLYHTRLVHRGETSIEIHLNDKARNRLSKRGLVYRNPYDWGPLANWKRFLGLHVKGRTIWRHLLLPSNHPPDSDGVTFDTTLLSIDEVLMEFV